MDQLEVIEELKKVDEVSILELLDITSEELVDQFYDKISLNLDRIYKYLRE